MSKKKVVKVSAFDKESGKVVFRFGFHPNVGDRLSVSYPVRKGRRKLASGYVGLYQGRCDYWHYFLYKVPPIPA